MRTVVRRHPGRPAAGRRPRRRRASSRELIGEDLRAAVALLGELTEADKAAFLRSVDVYCAPNLLGESFGVVLIEALAAGAPIVASDLDAFARVLEDGAAGVLVRRGDAAGAGRRAVRPARRPRPPGRARRRRGAAVAAGYDWACWPGGSSPSTRRSSRPAAARSTAGEDDEPCSAAVPPRADAARVRPAAAGAPLA